MGNRLGRDNQGIVNMAKRTDNQTRLVGDRRVKINTADKLLNDLLDMIAPSVLDHQTKVQRYRSVLMNLAGKTNNSGFDKAKEIAYAKGQTETVGDLRYTKTLGHINATAANIMQVLYPANQMYGSVEIDPERQKDNAALVTAMNHHGKRFKHYTNFYKAIVDSLCFNQGAIEVNWKVVNGITGRTQVNQKNVLTKDRVGVVKEGSQIKHLEPFNLILDHTVKAEEYPSQAQFYATVEMVSGFQLSKMAQDGELFLPETVRRALRKPEIQDGQVVNELNNNGFYASHGSVYSSGQGFTGLYEDRPEIRGAFYHKLNQPKVNGSTPFDANAYMGEVASSCNNNVGATNELLTITARIMVKDYKGLSSTGSRDANDVTDGFEIWRFKIVNGNHIVSAMPESLSHGLLPCCITRPRSELDELSGLSIAELLEPFQQASSSLLNVFLSQARSEKNKGLTFYDSRVRLGEYADMTSGRVPVELSDKEVNSNVRLSNLIANIPGNPPNQSTLQADAILDERMQDVFPTDSIQQLANLNRPVQHQTETLTNRQNMQIFVLSRVIHDEMLESCHYMQIKDVINYQKAIQITDSLGNVQEITAKSFEDVENEISVSDGLRGVDVVAVSGALERLIQYAFQSQMIQQEYDMGKLMAYSMRMRGVQFDLNSFKYDSPLDALSRQEKELAYQLLQGFIQQQQGEGNGGEGGNNGGAQNL